MAPQLKIYVPPHPLIKHWLGVARDKNTPSTLFKTAMVELGRWLTYEAIREWLPTMDVTVETPLALAPATFLNPETKIAIIPILRAGLTLAEGSQTILPLASTYHLGMIRDEKTLNPTCYLNKLPTQFTADTHILILDPMLATGGTIILAMEEIIKRGGNPDLTRIISVVSAPPALQKLSANYPTLNIYSAMIDEQINDNGFIVPGLGDAGDRAFGTE
ncbi:uracil phosphoribosyltransferase [Cyanobacterium aponinum AL20118]|uniref:Uracil phosphoribosyltransferase n=3 Tax=Cyanobacterium aponinum TaxID=379064 RepID=K9Z6E5_CYAAP|nr:uracil phosphoribosyltransferase [Cyanobacterium aponinum]AFZ54317.1 uracil phosphoribosyltransferase [Cyanobacterium aponinum PCC 10605]MBD2393924.1 uracil phosphoribosyltransferase [Cyanobacterium aponinum FACHB-4101]MTF39539.1 uracil phosphoribosyltransferase [Cyanobacterium aponinum 0216]WPF89018.1 uracil phosphoribosyltransferase [Cyanobacterium aponinum AL20115]